MNVPTDLDARVAALKHCLTQTHRDKGAQLLVSDETMLALIAAWERGQRAIKIAKRRAYRISGQTVEFKHGVQSARDQLLDVLTGADDGGPR